MDDQKSIRPLALTHTDSLPPPYSAKTFSEEKQSDDSVKRAPSFLRNVSTWGAERRMSRFGWWWEVYAAVLAVASTICIVAILVAVQNKPLASWKWSIQPNSIVAVFSTVIKTALLFPIAECISQLKWTYFESPRTLAHMQTFDDASRGPWGALVLIWRTRTAALLASMGAFITIMMLAFEPFTQQVIGVEVRDMAMANETGMLWYAPSFKDHRLGPDSWGVTKYGVSGIDDTKIDTNVRITFGLAMMAALTGRSSIYQSNYLCGTERCTFPRYNTLSATPKCETKTIRTDEALGCAYYIRHRDMQTEFSLEPVTENRITQRFAHLKDFKDALKKDKKVYVYGSNCTITKPDFPTITITYEYNPEYKTVLMTGGRDYYAPFQRRVAVGSEVIGNSMISQDEGDKYFGTDTVDPVDASGAPFSFCASNMYRNGTKFPTLDGFTLSTYTCLDTKGIFKGITALDTLGEFTAELTHCSVSLSSSAHGESYLGENTTGINLPITQTTDTSNSKSKSQTTLSTSQPLRMLQNATNATNFTFLVTAPNTHRNFTINPFSMIYLGQMIEETLYSENAQDFFLQSRSAGHGWPAVIHNISTVMSDYMHSSDNPGARKLAGTAWAPQPFINVVWGWLALPLVLVVMSVGLLVLTAVQSTGKPYLYKTSVLAATFHGLEGWEAEGMKRAVEDREMGKDLVEQAETVEAKFVNEDGRLRFVRQR